MVHDRISLNVFFLVFFLISTTQVHSASIEFNTEKSCWKNDSLSYGRRSYIESQGEAKTFERRESTSLDPLAENFKSNSESLSKEQFHCIADYLARYYVGSSYHTIARKKDSNILAFAKTHSGGMYHHMNEENRYNVCSSIAQFIEKIDENLLEGHGDHSGILLSSLPAVLSHALDYETSRITITTILDQILAARSSRLDKDSAFLDGLSTFQIDFAISLALAEKFHGKTLRSKANKRSLCFHLAGNSYDSQNRLAFEFSKLETKKSPFIHFTAELVDYLRESYSSETDKFRKSRLRILLFALKDLYPETEFGSDFETLGYRENLNKMAENEISLSAMVVAAHEVYGLPRKNLGLELSESVQVLKIRSFKLTDEFEENQLRIRAHRSDELNQTIIAIRGTVPSPENYASDMEILFGRLLTATAIGAATGLASYSAPGIGLMAAGCRVANNEPMAKRPESTAKKEEPISSKQEAARTGIGAGIVSAGAALTLAGATVGAVVGATSSSVRSISLLNQMDKYYQIVLRRVLEVLEKYDLKPSTDRVYLTGHSLGGYLAQYVAATLQVKGSSFNAPSIANNHLKYRDMYQQTFLCINSCGDFIGNKGVKNWNRSSNSISDCRILLSNNFDAEMALGSSLDKEDHELKKRAIYKGFNPIKFHSIESLAIYITSLNL